jgi:hypothetical protein
MRVLSSRRRAEPVFITEVVSCIPARAMYALGLTATMLLGFVGELNNAVPARALMSLSMYLVV